MDRTYCENNHESQTSFKIITFIEQERNHESILQSV